MLKIILTTSVILIFFYKASADVNIEAIKKGLAELKEIQDKIIQREEGRVYKDDPRIEDNMNKIAVGQRKYLTHTWNVFSSLTAYIESVLKSLLDDLMKPHKEEQYFQEIVTFLDEVILKGIDSNTKQCKKEQIKENSCDLLKLWPRDCSDVIPKISGITRITHRLNSYLFYCEQDLFQGGWTLFWQSDLSFFIKYRNMTDVTNPDFRKFIHGFGIPCKDEVYTLGLEMVHRLTLARKYQMLIYYENVDGTSFYSHFREFSIGSVETGYNATVLGSSFGNATVTTRKGKVTKLNPYDDEKRHLLMRFRSMLPQKAWGRVRMLLRPSEIKLNATKHVP